MGKIGRASADAKDALGGVSGMVVTTGGAIAQPHAKVSDISSNTQDVLHE